MQDPYMYAQINSQAQQQPQFPEQEQLKCPRCDSLNTKFCYYNNYNLSQPRHFCKSCKRYWTKGGALRNIPVGGGSRKNAKRSSSSSNNQQSKRPAASSSPSDNSNNSAAGSESLPLKGEDSYGPGQFGNFMDVSGSFSSLLGSSGGRYGNFLGSNLALGDHFGGPDQGHHGLCPQIIGMGSGNSNNGDGFLNIDEGGESGCWSGSPDLAIYTPRSNFH